MTAAVEKRAHIWERDGLDWYVEPPGATEALLRAERFVGPCFDPCCGGGNIVEALRAAGYDAAGSDVVRRTSAGWFYGVADFLGTDYSAHRARLANIVMNPPFFRAKGAESFIRKALEVATGKVCAFVDIKFLAGTGRANGLFAEHPPHRVWVITPRPSCPPGEFLAAGNEAGGGTADWCWLVWDKTAPAGRAEFGWLRKAGAVTAIREDAMPVAEPSEAA
jgi:predicted RNA methylase